MAEQADGVAQNAEAFSKAYEESATQSVQPLEVAPKASTESDGENNFLAALFGIGCALILVISLGFFFKR